MTNHDLEGIFIALCVGALVWFGSYRLPDTLRWIFLGAAMLGGSLIIAVIFPGWILDYQYIDRLEAFFWAGFLIPLTFRFVYWAYTQQEPNKPAGSEAEDPPEQIAS